MATPTASKRLRDRVSPSNPNSGAVSVYTIKNPVINAPSCVSERRSSECFMLSASAATIQRSR